MANTILNDKRFGNLLMNGGFDVWQRGTALGTTYTTATTSSGSANITALTNVVTTLRTGMTVTGTTVGTSKTISTLTSNTAIAMNSGTGATNATASATVAFGLPNGAYSADRWYVLTQTSGVQVARTTGNTARFGCKITQNAIGAPGNQRFGIAQVVEAEDSIESRGDTVTFQMKFQVTNLQPVRAAILEWSGTADSVTDNVVNSWTNATYAAGKFFNATTLTVTAVSAAVTPTAVNTWTDLIVQGQISNTCNNIVVMVWVQDTAATGFALSLSDVLLSESAVELNYIPKVYATELLNCKRFFERINLNAANGLVANGFASTSTSGLVGLTFMEKIATPTVSFFGLVADASVVIAGGTAIAATAVAGSVPSKTGALYTVTVASGLTAGSGLYMADSGNATHAALEVSAEL